MNTDREGGAGDRLIKRVLGSLRDHASGKLTRWEIFGLSVDLPASLRAVRNRFNQGFITFSAAAPGSRVELARWTLANMHLAHTDLAKFLNMHLLKRRNLPPVTIKDAVVQSHPAKLFHTKRKLLEGARAAVRKALRFRQPAYRTGLIWHCHTSNRIILLDMGSNKYADVGAARLLASRVRCCKVVY
jgi:hypothetical protein